MEAGCEHRIGAGGTHDTAYFHGLAMSIQKISERVRSATFGPITVSLATHNKYETALPGDNFGHPWRATRIFFPLEGALRFSSGSSQSGGYHEVGAKQSTVGARSAALAAGWYPMQLACDGATQVLEVDIAAERFEERDLLLQFKFAMWAPESCLPSATAMALRELMDRPATLAPIRAETNRVVSTLIGSLLQAAQTYAETRTPASAKTRHDGPQLGQSALIGQAPRLGHSGQGGEPAQKLDHANIIKYLMRKHTDPALTPAAVADHFNVSLRTLYRSFGDDDEGISRALANARLATALEKLADPALADYPLDEVALKCGYRSALSLRRAVFAATGENPTALRAKRLT